MRELRFREMKVLCQAKKKKKLEKNKARTRNSFLLALRIVV